MVFIRDYTEGDYEITQYTGGGSVRDRLTGRIVASYTNFRTKDGSTHPKTQEEIDHIKERLGLDLQSLSIPHTTREKV